MALGARFGRGSAGLIMLLLATPKPVDGQFVRHVRWPLVDVLVRGDTNGRLEILASPNLSSTEGLSDKTHLSRIKPNPVAALEWAQGMRPILDSVVKEPRSVRVFVFRPGLSSRRAGDSVAIGAGGTAGPPFRFMVTHKDTARSWQVAVSAKEVRELLAALVAIAGAALGPEQRKDQLRHDGRRPWCPISHDSVSTEDDLDTMPSALSTRLEYPISERRENREGRVWLQFVIDTTGLIAPGSACVLFADTDIFAGAVLRSAPHFRFKPGIVAGKPAPMLAFQEFRFMIRRDPFQFPGDRP